MTALARAAALVLACLLAAYAVGLGGARGVLAVLALIGVALVAAAAISSAGWAGWAGVFVLGAAYVVAVSLRDRGLDPFAPAVAVGLYLVVEALEVATLDGERAAARAWHSLTVGFVSALAVAGLLLAGAATTADGPLAVAASAACGALVLVGLTAVLGPRETRD